MTDENTRDIEKTLKDLQEATAAGRVQIGPDGLEDLAAECAMGMINGSDGPQELKYLKLDAWSEGASSKLPGFEIAWGISNCGFGSLTFYHDPETGKLMVDDECMGKEFCMMLLEVLFDEALKNTNERKQGNTHE